MTIPYPVEQLDDDEDCGVMPENVAKLAESVVGHRIVSAHTGKAIVAESGYRGRVYTREGSGFVLTLDNGEKVLMEDSGDCCAYTELQAFLLHPDKVDHMITGVGTTDGYRTWHIYADAGDVLELTVRWSCGNPFYYGYGFDINVIPIDAEVDQLAIEQ